MSKSNNQKIDHILSIFKDTIEEIEKKSRQMSQEELLMSLTKAQIDALAMIGLKLSAQKNAIELLTLFLDAEAIFKLSDEDWCQITGFDINIRIPFEFSIRKDWDRFVELWNSS
jgi:hypothetical protein